MSKKSTDRANEILDMLVEASKGYYPGLSSKHLAEKLSISQGNIVTLTWIMDRLVSAGLVVKKGKSYWDIVKGATWDRRDPFKPQFKATEPDNYLVSGLQKQIHELTLTNKQLTDDFLKVESENKELKEKAKGKPQVFVVKHHKGNEVKMKGVLPSYFKKILSLAQCRRNILLVGPAGCGKTTLGAKLAEAFAMDFGSVSLTDGMTEVHLLGRSVPDLTHGKNRFQGTEFLKIYEGGGVYLFDELDAANPNMLLAINSGLANGYINVPNRPDRPRAEKHEDFVCVATANTMGRGATRQYSGRNQLDESTIDRFRIGIVECDYDPDVERALCPDDELRTTLQDIRRRIDTSGLRRIMSTRFLEDAYVMLSEAEWTVDEIVTVFLQGWSNEEKAKVRS